MIRTLKLMTLGALSVLLLANTGCEDKVCQQDLQTCKKESSDLRKESASSLSTIQELKTQLADAQAKVDSLSKENADLKKAAEDASKTKGKVKGKTAKGKKKKGKR